jgi:hypothetical protein
VKRSWPVLNFWCASLLVCRRNIRHQPQYLRDPWIVGGLRPPHRRRLPRAGLVAAPACPHGARRTRSAVDNTTLPWFGPSLCKTAAVAARPAAWAITTPTRSTASAALLPTHPKRNTPRTIPGLPQRRQWRRLVVLGRLVHHRRQRLPERAGIWRALCLRRPDPLAQWLRCLFTAAWTTAWAMYMPST